jgi:N6-L-threonylcarbamoyladenine synthase
VAGGVGANRQLRSTLDNEAKRRRFRVYYPELEFCTDNGAMIALAGCLRLQAGAAAKPAGDFAVQPRWPLMDTAAGAAQ